MIIIINPATTGEGVAFVRAKRRRGVPIYETIYICVYIYMYTIRIRRDIVRGENSEKVNAFLTTIFPRDFSSKHYIFSIESRLKRLRKK